MLLMMTKKIPTKNPRPGWIAPRRPSPPRRRTCRGPRRHPRRHPRRRPNLYAVPDAVAAARRRAGLTKSLLGSALLLEPRRTRNLRGVLALDPFALCAVLLLGARHRQRAPARRPRARRHRRRRRHARGGPAREKSARESLRRRRPRGECADPRSSRGPDDDATSGRGRDGPTHRRHVSSQTATHERTAPPGAARGTGRVRRHSLQINGRRGKGSHENENTSSAGEIQSARS